MNRRCGGPPHGPIAKTALAKKVALSKNGKHCLFPELRQNSKLHVAALDEKHRVCGLSLPKDGLVVAVLPNSFSFPDLPQQCCAIHLERCAVDIHPLPASRLRLRRAPGRGPAPHGVTLSLGRTGRWSIMLSAPARALAKCLVSDQMAFPQGAWLVTTSKQLLLIARAMSFIAQTTGSGVGTVDGIAKSVRKEMKCCSQS